MGYIDLGYADADADTDVDVINTNKTDSSAVDLGKAKHFCYLIGTTRKSHDSTITIKENLRYENYHS